MEGGRSVEGADPRGRRDLGPLEQPRRRGVGVVVDVVVAAVAEATDFWEVGIRISR